MKRLRMNGNWPMKSLIFSLALFASASTHAISPEGGAGNGAGNGGNAVLIDGKYYLFDLVEAGIEKTSSLPLPHEMNSPELRRLTHLTREVFESRPDFPVELSRALLLKLNDLPPVLAAKFMAAFSLYQWNIVNLPLREIKITDSVIDLEGMKVFQAAVRDGEVITLNKGILQQMDIVNQVALVFHEVFYSVLRPTPRVDGFEEQRSSDARTVVARIFRPEWKYRQPWNVTRHGKSIFSFFPEKNRSVEKGESSELSPTITYVSDEIVLRIRSGFSERKTELETYPFLHLSSPDPRSNGRGFSLELLQLDPAAPFGADGPNFGWVREACRFVLAKWEGSLMVINAQRVSTAEFRDYLSPNGAAKYVEFSQELAYHVTSDGSAKRGATGSQWVRFETQETCEKELPGVLHSQALTLLPSRASRN